jgi:hypothetical protein
LAAWLPTSGLVGVERQLDVADGLVDVSLAALGILGSPLREAAPREQEEDGKGEKEFEVHGVQN